jgi:hypothetical protein
MGAIKKQNQRIAPRWKIQEENRRHIRFKPTRGGKIIATRIFDISSTGISFLTSERGAPRVGEVIFMEFAPLGNVRMAVTGRVVRIEIPPRDSTWGKYPQVKVGVAFHNLPRAYQKSLVRNITEAIDKKPEFYVERRQTSRASSGPSVFEAAVIWLADNGLSLFISTLAIVFLCAGVYAVIQNSDSRQKTQNKWATGFFDKVIVKPSK